MFTYNGNMASDYGLQAMQLLTLLLLSPFLEGIIKQFEARVKRHRGPGIFQSGNINLYNGLLGIVLILALASVIFW